MSAGGMDDRDLDATFSFAWLMALLREVHRRADGPEERAELERLLAWTEALARAQVPPLDPSLFDADPAFEDDDEGWMEP